jgi:UDP-N-acetylglucosamine--N-acetylmuramyl-(pentapeptide) pyrophosphoryl-undecaprenol N-acetylglucosamine transferase
MSERPVAMIMAGGTGGHVFPALALARRLQRASCDVVWLGTRRGIEARVVPAAGIPMEWVDVSGVRGKQVATLLAAPFRIGKAIWQSLAAMRRRQPIVVVGLGGFVSGPGGVAAWLSRRPLVIHEQNAVAGLTNRLLARVATTVLQAFPGGFRTPRRNATVIGNPVRDEFFAQSTPEARRAPAPSRGGTALRLLVIGGSQGALKLNQAVPQALAQLTRAGWNIAVRHQTGERWRADTEQRYREAAVPAQAESFIDDVAAAYAAADLVICRAGALTVSEIAAVGVAAVLVPFAAAVDDHQTANARFLVDADAAILVPEHELTPQRLATELESLLLDPARLAAMARNARQLARPDATERLAKATFEAAGLHWEAAA